MESNRGTIEVESAPDKGSRFCIQLPAVDPSLLDADAATVQTPASQSALKLQLWEALPVEKLLKIKGKKILIVDDNAEVRKFLKLFLSDTFEIFEAANGKEALQLATETVPAIIITDVLMPDMNGLEFCRTVKSQTATSHVPVVVLTSRQDDGTQVEGYEAGADIYLTKPVKKELLLQVILTLLQNGERLRENIFEKIMGHQSLAPEGLTLTKLDETFLTKLVKLIEENIAEPALDAKLLGKELAVSRTVLYTKVKALTGQTVHEFIKSVRLRRSLQLLLGRRVIHQPDCL